MTDLEFVKKFRTLINRNCENLTEKFKDNALRKAFWDKFEDIFEIKLGNNGLAIFHAIRKEYNDEFNKHGALVFRDFISNDVQNIEDQSGKIYNKTDLYHTYDPFHLDGDLGRKLSASMNTNFVLGVNGGNPLIAVKDVGTWKIQKQQIVKTGLSTIKQLKIILVSDGNGGKKEKIIITNSWNEFREHMDVFTDVGFYAGDVPEDHFNCMDVPQPELKGTIFYHQGGLYNMKDLSGYNLESDEPTFEDLKPIIEAYLEPILNHIFLVFCDSEPESYIWLMAWLAFTIAFPSENQVSL